jgi:nitroreductase
MDKSNLVSLADVMPFGKMLPNAGAAVVVCGIPEKSIPSAPEYWIHDCSAASENILLAAESMGLGAVWLGVHPIPERVEGVKNILNVPENVVPLNIISISCPKGSESPETNLTLRIFIGTSGNANESIQTNLTPLKLLIFNYYV